MKTAQTFVFLLCAMAGTVATAGREQSLRLVPFPKQVQMAEGGFRCDRPLVLQVPAGQAELLARLVCEELRRADLPLPKVVPSDQPALRFRPASSAGTPPTTVPFRQGATQEDYLLEVRPEEITAAAPGAPGLFYAVQTLCQLIRANRQGNSLPCLRIADWPSLRWRCFQDDMTRGPSPRLQALRSEVALGAGLKMNLFTYYMEYQFAFRKHPQIGPANGSLQPEELEALVRFAKQHHVEILGNQQSFGHFSRILEHPQYAHLRETPSLLCPVKEETYQLLDDLYSEVCPLLPFEWFNVCCDETWGLGTGPSKDLAQRIGVGGVYARHICRIHDLLQKKYHKRMMMWGDIVLQHPEALGQIPRDTIMLTWGYGPKESFETQIVPFADAGFEFFVCPGISNWSRILPDFGTATINIRNFVRDGAKHGTLGMLNTAWEDDGEALGGYKWHGYAWGAECAWNASTTPAELFNRRIGAVLFGERGDHFGRAIELLSQTHRLPGMQGMNNRRFWQDDFLPTRSPSAIRKSAERLLALVRPALEHLEACRAEAVANRQLLDYFIFGARRMERIGQRMLDGLEAARLYTQATESPPEKALELLDRVESLVEVNRDSYQLLSRQFEQLWLAESKPYALDWTLARYEKAIARYDSLLRQLAVARRCARQGKQLPPAESLGLLLPEEFPRRARPSRTVGGPLLPESPWHDPQATSRLGLSVSAGSVDRYDLPVEVEVSLPPELVAGSIRAFASSEHGSFRPIPAQLDPADRPNHQRLVLLLPGRLPKGTSAKILVYLGGNKGQAPTLPTGAVFTSDAPDGNKWIENNRLRLLLGHQGAHVFCWEVKQHEGRDLTMPGRSGWSGFSDINPWRNTPYRLRCIARGPALVRYQCTAEHGPTKWISVYAQASWMEVVLSEPTTVYWDFDNPANFAANRDTPGKYLFSDGTGGPVPAEGPYTQSQVKVQRVHWAIKYHSSGDRRLALGLVTPELAANFVVGPGSGAGGVGIENSPPATHFVTYAGVLEADPAETMKRLEQTLNFRNQPQVMLYALEHRPAAR